MYSLSVICRLLFVFTLLSVLFYSVNGECYIEENSIVFVPVCDIKRIFPEIESPNVDNFRHLFRLNGTKLEVKQSLDRENLISHQNCDILKLSNYNSNGQCAMILELSGKGPIFRQLSIVVTDVNDNVPSFDRLLFDIRIPENSPSNKEFELPQARDPDRGKNSTIVYSLEKIETSHKYVLLNPSSNGAVDFPLKLKIMQPFDREVEKEVRLVVVAKDLGRPPLSSSLTIKIEITDVNDHAPKFNQSSYRFNIPESTSQGQHIGQVFATDNDVSSRISIMMSPSASSQIMDRFSVAFDGLISSKTGLEYTSSNYEYRLPVIAVDGGTPALTASAIVFVHVTDINDNSPVIEVTSSYPHNRLLLTENCPPNTYIAKVTAKDKDHGVNGQVECKLDNNYLFSLEPIQQFDNRRYYKFVTAPLSNFDRETKESHLANIICHDNGTPSLTSTRPVTVLVQDENDNAPLFAQPHLSVSIPENQKSGYHLCQLHAKDRDIQVNRQTNYRLSDESSTHFNIDTQTGLITSRGPFDREQMATLTIQATAYDSLLPRLQSNVTVHVTILDENDNYPRFTKGLSVHVKENTEGFIGRVEAVDDDEGKNGEVEFFLISSSDTFQVSKTGDITVFSKSNLDREKIDRYSLEIGARDKGQAALTATATVDIVVDDLNDNFPVFHTPHQGQQINISAASLPGTKVFTVEAIDHDAGVNNKITYSLRPEGVFVINPMDGNICLNRTISSDTDLPFKLIVYAKDGGVPSLTAMSSLTLHYVHYGVVSPTLSDKRAEPRISSSKDLILSLGIGMVLLIFACLMMLVTYFCVSIFIQKRRQNGETEYKVRDDIQSWLCACLSSNDDERTHRDPRIPSTLQREQTYPMCFNRWETSRDRFSEEDPLYSYREFTMQPMTTASASPQVYDRLASQPYWHYSTIDRLSQAQTERVEPVPAVIYHHGHPHAPRRSHPDIVNFHSVDEVDRDLYGDLSPPSAQSALKMSIFSQPNYDNEKPDYESITNLSPGGTLGPDNSQSTARFAGYVVGSPCYANSFV